MGVSALRRFGAPLLLAVCTTAPMEALGEASSGEVRRARELFEQAVTQFEAGLLDEALSSFQESFDLYGHPETLYNIAGVLSRQGRYLEAIRAFEQFLGDSPDIDEARRSRVREEISELRSRLGRVTIEVVPDGAAVIVDGEHVATTPVDGPLLLDPGDRRLAARLPGYEEHVQELTIVTGDNPPLEIALRPQLARLTLTGPPRTLVEVDGSPVGELPLQRPLELYPGRHLVRATTEGHEPRSQELEALPGSEVTVALSPGRRLPYGRLRFVGDEAATVLLDGEPVGELPLALEVASGQRTVAIEGEGLNRWEGTIAIDPGEVREARVRLGRPNSGPPMGAIWALTTMSAVLGATALGFGIASLRQEDSYDEVSEAIFFREYDGLSHLSYLQRQRHDAHERALGYSIACDVSWSVGLTSGAIALLLYLLRRSERVGPEVTVTTVASTDEEEAR